MSPTVPTYALYGEHEQPLIPESLHCESIAQRSRLYEWEIQPHRHDLFLQILYIRAGGGEAWFEERRVSFKAPCVMFVPPLSVHGFRFARNVDGSVITVVAQQLDTLLRAAPQLAARLAASAPQCLAFEPRDVRNGGAFAQIEAALTQLMAEFHGNAPWRMAAIEASLSLALVLIGRALAAAQQAIDGAGPRSLQHVQRFRALVDRRFRTERSIAAYAAQVGITPTQLNRVCRQVLGKSALGVIQDRLIVEAKRDLAYTILSVKEIALTLGFVDAAYFTRFFAQHTGQAPSDFRQAARRHIERAWPRPRIRTEARASIAGA
jgi:AraC family transcriptional activator of pobA